MYRLKGKNSRHNIIDNQATTIKFKKNKVIRVKKPLVDTKAYETYREAKATEINKDNVRELEMRLDTTTTELDIEIVEVIRNKKNKTKDTALPNVTKIFQLTKESG